MGVVAVTGAGGYVGQNLVARLLDDGAEVRALDRERPSHADPRADWRTVDVLDADGVRAALDGVEVVHHLAARITLAHQDPLAWQVNTEGVRNVARAALDVGVRRMVHASSLASFDLRRCRGDLREDSPRTEDEHHPVYGRSKLAGERIFLDVVADGLDGLVCYPTTLLGPADRGAALSQINKVALDAARGRLPALIEGSIDLVDVRDVADGMVAAAEHGRTGEGYFLGGEFCRLVDVFRDVAALVGRAGPRATAPMSLVRRIAPLVTARSKRPDHPLAAIALDSIEFSPPVDHGRAADELGFAPRPIAETLRDLAAHLVHEGHLRPGTATGART